MPVRTANAEWRGNLKDGKGSLALGSGAFKGDYSFGSRFESGKGTNPEELIGAAHAGCYSMALAANLAQAGFAPKSVKTGAKVHIEKDGDGFSIKKIELDTVAEVPGIETAEFRKHARATMEGCPVSKALRAVQISLNAKLV